ncbi:hypothetical protein AC249_AIPGENE20363 [Exaiptasia diaphana]|nr:hypothetical protein AC249_AIPGENE20363 [Exaiptasia diaphana]
MTSPLCCFIAVDRILGDNEYPLEIQTKWKPNEGRVFFLTRLKKKPDSNPAVQNAPETTSEELRNEIARQNQTIDTMNETIQRLQLKQDIKTENSQHIYTANYSASDQNDYDKIDDMNQDTSISKRVNKRIRFNDSEETNNRQQSASAYGVDLHKPRLEKQNDSISKRPSQSQINKLRRSFDRYRKKSYDDSDLELMRKTNVDNAESKNVECSSQIERFRHNFLKYYNIRNGNKLHKPISRSWSTSDAEYYDIAKNLASVADVLDKPQKSLLEPNNYSNNRELETVLSRNSSFNSLCDREIRRVFENAQIQKQDPESNKTLYDVIKEKELVAVTMKREPGKELGLELAHVTQTGSPIDDPCEVMYVFHKSDGNTSIVGSPTSILSEDDNQVIDYENEVDDVFADSPSELSQDSHICFGSQSDDSSQSNSPKPTLDDTVAGDAKKETGEPGSPGSCCTLAEWREGNGPKPHHGVRIVGVTAGSIAENAKTLEKGDVIVEVNGVNVLNSNLEVVIDALRHQNTVSLVIARQKQESMRHVTTTNTTMVTSPLSSPNHDDMQEQVQQLAAKLTEMEKTLHKKDKYISHLKKSLMKRKLKLTSKEKIEEAVQVIV